MAQAGLEMMGRDFDGRVIVNYLGDFFRDHLLESIDNMVFEHAYNFVNQQLKSYQESQDTKLAFRYSILHGYFFEHLGKPAQPA
jgi:hypothetical protein